MLSLDRGCERLAACGSRRRCSLVQNLLRGISIPILERFVYTEDALLSSCFLSFAVALRFYVWGRHFNSAAKAASLA
jgi:hypothetical protein